MKITGITISVECKDMEFNNGEARFMSIKAEAPEGEELDMNNDKEVVDQALKMFEHAWKGIQGSRYTAGVIPGGKYTSLIEMMNRRVGKLRASLELDTE